MAATGDPFSVRDTLASGETLYRIDRLVDPLRLPYTVCVLLENLLRRAGSDHVAEQDVRALAAWPDPAAGANLAFMPARVIMQDLTGVPAVVDLAAMRAAVARAGGDPERVNPLVPVDLVIDHSVQVDAFGSDGAYARNIEREFERNGERYALLRWAQEAFRNFRVVPPGMGIVHQVNLEYLGRGGAGARRCGHARLAGRHRFPHHHDQRAGRARLGRGRHRGRGRDAGPAAVHAAAGGAGRAPFRRASRRRHRHRPGADHHPAAARAWRGRQVRRVLRPRRPRADAGRPRHHRQHVARVRRDLRPCSRWTSETIAYLRDTGRAPELVALVERYTKEQGLFRTGQEPATRPSPTTLDFDLDQVEPSLAGPRRPQDRVLAGRRPRASFSDAVRRQPGERHPAAADGSVAIAAITSCTNTSNPSLMVAAGLLAKKAVERGLQTKPWVKTSLAPGSRVVTDYLDRAGLPPYLERSASTWSATAAPPASATAARSRKRSATRSTDATWRWRRCSPATATSRPASIPRCAPTTWPRRRWWSPTPWPARVDIDLTRSRWASVATASRCISSEIWPTAAEVAEAVRGADLSRPVRGAVRRASSRATSAGATCRCRRGSCSSGIPTPPTCARPPSSSGRPTCPTSSMPGCWRFWATPSPPTTSRRPARSRSDTPAGRYLIEHGVEPREFNSYGARRGNHEVMVRGTFANIRLRNRIVDGVEGGFTRALPRRRADVDLRRRAALPGRRRAAGGDRRQGVRLGQLP